MTSGDVTISISKFIDDHIRYFFPNQKSKIKQINRGIDCEYFNSKAVTEVRKEKFLSTLMISEKTHIILLPARITSWKGHDVALDAVKILTNNNPELNFVLIFVGSEENRSNFTKKLKKKIIKLKITNRVIFCGNISDMPAVYSVADIVLSTSIEPEAFGRVSAEACAMSKPVISTNHGGSREIIENNVTGWLVEPKNPEDLANKIIYVLNLNQRKKDLIGQNAQKKIRERFSLKEMLVQTLQVYEELIERKKILIIKFGGLGDIILSLNAIYSIRKKFKNSKFFLLTEKPYDKFLKKSKWFDDILVIKRSFFYFYDVIQIKKTKNILSVDKVFDLQTSKRSSFYLKVFHQNGIYTNGIGRFAKVRHDNPNRDNLHTLTSKKSN